MSYAVTYTGHDQYYGRVPELPICISYPTALKVLIDYDNENVPPYIKTLHIEHRECGEPTEYCNCEGEPHNVA